MNIRIIATNWYNNQEGEFTIKWNVPAIPQIDHEINLVSFINFVDTTQAKKWAGDFRIYDIHWQMLPSGIMPTLYVTNIPEEVKKNMEKV